jgi:hypothetical protein
MYGRMKKVEVKEMGILASIQKGYEISTYHSLLVVDFHYPITNKR